MKKVYLTGALLFMAVSVFAQNIKPTYSFGHLENRVYNGELTNEIRPNSEPLSENRAVALLWNENFTDTTVNGGWTTEGPDESYWSLSSATTAPNGFGLSMNGQHFLWDSRTPIGGATGGDEPGGFATTAVDGSIITPAIDLNGYSAALLEFDLNAMFCCNDEPWSISISNDNGSNWSAPIPLNLDMSANDNTNDFASPVKYSLIISDYLDVVPANNDQVKIKFSWTAIDANTNGQISSHYYWTIDNINIFELPAYDIKQVNLWMADVNNGLEYTSFPANQMSTLTVQSPLLNSGVGAPTNIAMEITTFDASNTIIDGPVEGGSLLIGSLNSGERDTITFATAIDLSGYALGDYTVRSVIKYDETDEVTANDTVFRTFKVVENSMGHDNFDLSMTTNQIGYTNDSKTGATFEISNAVDLHGVDMYLVNSGGTVNTTTLGQIVYIYIDDAATGNEVAYFEYEITADMLGDWNTFNFYQAENADDFTLPLALDAGNSYFVTIYVSTGSTLWYAASFTDEDNSSAFYWGGDQSWYANGDEPWLRLNFDQTLNIESANEINNISVAQNAPNPFNGNTVITYNLNEASNVTLQVVDLAGKVITTINEGNQNAGEHNLTIDGSTLAEGTYFYTFTAGEYRVTKKMVVSK